MISRFRRRLILSDFAQNINNFLTIVALENGLTSSISMNSGQSCEYCINFDRNWKTLSPNEATPAINSGETISFKGNLIPVNFGNNSAGVGTFTVSKKYKLMGNCESIFDFSHGIKNSAFSKLFMNSTTLIDASELILPSTNVSAYMYNRMFEGCTSLTTAPKLPATKVGSGSYYRMFYNCTSLTKVPDLPATEIDYGCYSWMFYNCASLTTAPAELPATTLGTRCYEYMFNACGKLTIAPKLPATILKEECYSNMFNTCSGLVTAPKLSATTLAHACCYAMFANCIKLTTAPDLPATSLATSCYRKMFENCTSLTKAPDLPATNLTEDCYNIMFQACKNLNYVKMLATNISASNCLNNWLGGVSSTGTFVKSSSMTSLPSGSSGIPSGWTVVNDGEESDGDKYFTVIYFNGEKKNYVYEEGMTWEEFINSDYNVDGWSALSTDPFEPKGVHSITHGFIYNDDDSYVYITDIISNKNYYLG